MDLRRLHYFVAVAEFENFHRASEALFVAQSALSKHVKILSETVGGPLFERTSNGVTLTQLGRILYKESKLVLARYDNIFVRTRQALNGDVGKLTIAVDDSGGRNLHFAHCIRQFHEQYPCVDLEFLRYDPQEHIFALKSGKIDAAVVSSAYHDLDDFESITIDSDRLLLALPETHPLAERDLLEVEDIADIPFIAVQRGRFHSLINKLIAQYVAINLEPRFAMDAASEQMQLTLIRQGLGIGFVSEAASNFMVKGVVLRPLRGMDFRLETKIFWRSNDDFPSLLNFANTIRASTIADAQKI
jgi:DNA-binding transcriptional LysR family regulator